MTKIYEKDKLHLRKWRKFENLWYSVASDQQNCLNKKQLLETLADIQSQ